MRRLQKKLQSSAIRDSPREPMAESLTAIPKNSHGHRDWLSISDDQLIRYARDFMKEKGITGRKQLQESDPGLYKVLGEKKLRAKIGFEKIRNECRNWSIMTDKQLICRARVFMEEKGITGRKQLDEADPGLYSALCKRKLVVKVGFEQKRRECRDWSSMTDDQLILRAQHFMKEKGMTGREQLKKADEGLYDALRRRKLLAKVGFEQKCRDWSSMTDGQLIHHARDFMIEMGITGRKQLERANRVLYGALWRRCLLSLVFAGTDQPKNVRIESQLVSELRKAADAMAEFGGEKG